MTIQEMHIGFKLELDKSNSLQYPDFEPEEIDYWLNRSIQDIIRQRYTGNNSRRESVEETQKRRDDLRNVTTNRTETVFTNNLNNKPNGVFVKLPDDYAYALNEEALILKNDCHGNQISLRVPVRAITHDRYNKMSRDPFNEPNEDDGIYCLPYEGNLNELICNDGETISAYYLRYLRKPATVNYYTSVDCDLSDHIHSEIISYAVNLAIENIESPRIITQSPQINKNE